VKLAEARFKAGAVLQSDLLRAKVQYAEVKEMTTRSANGVKLASANLNFAMGVPQDEGFEVAGALSAQDMKEDLDAMIAAEQAKGLSIQVGIAAGPPEKEILHLVRDEKIDLLIMLAHEEGYLEQSLFGSLNEKIHRKLPCTVMFIKQEPLPVKNQSFCLRADRVQPCEAY